MKYRKYILTGFLKEPDKLDLQMYMEEQKAKIAKILLKKNKVRRYLLTRC